MRDEWTIESVRLNGGDGAAAIAEALLGREIRVTKQMIRDGSKNDCRDCPVALAIRAVFPEAEVYADLWMIEINKLVRFNTPDNVDRFMNRFDFTRNRESMSGIRFTLTELQPYYRSPLKSH